MICKIDNIDIIFFPILIWLVTLAIKITAQYYNSLSSQLSPKMEALESGNKKLNLIWANIYLYGYFQEYLNLQASAS